ncbi:MAG TPA: PLP-dependent transferase [Candidatus Dormibacteraeota bacterium]|nr:PLP-dependent transferase [Candidatus Dormibacteraeota bacterium]
MKLETLMVHAGAERDPATGSLAPPIHLSTTFEHGPGGERPHGLIYIRDGNPTEARLEPALAAAEGGGSGLVFASGVAAGAALLQALPPESHVLFPEDIYFVFRVMASQYLPRWGLTHTFVDMQNLDAVRAAIRPGTRAVWTESPSNPLMRVTDLAGIAAIARDAGALLVCDNTFATPVLQRPLELGADVVLHSTTKYLGGHSDVQGGALIFAAKHAPLAEKTHSVRTVTGGVASPFNSWLVLRGLRSLPCRMERHASNALALARALQNHPSIETVHYPGLADDPGHEVARRQMKAFGGMLSIRVKGGRERAVAVAARVRLFTNATSLGGTESLIEHRASSEGPATTTPQNLLRISAGLEHPDDLVADLEQALAGG